MGDTIDTLVKRAGEAVNAGRWDEAERLWREVHRQDPHNPAALFSLGVHALRARDPATAAKLIEQSLEAAPGNLLALLTLARAHRELGNDDREGQSLEMALSVDPYYLPAMLAQAARLDRLGRRVEAATLQKYALKVAGPEDSWPPVMRPQLLQARASEASFSEGLHAHLIDQVDSSISALPEAEKGKWREAVSILAGRTQPYKQQSNQLHIPRLPAIPFYDRGQFSWAAALEAKTDAIRAELMAALERRRGDFSPYIALRPGQPVDQWGPLNHSSRWSHYGLWRSGRPDEAHLAECPETRKALEAVDMADIEGLCPNVMFSALEPHTQIPPHTGETNARIVAHLPLIVPEKCTYRVGFERREWREGELLVFDDTIEHEARNDSDELRVVLIFDIWNPNLSLAERDMVRAMATATRAFEARPAG
ncbi:MAG: tetratricopeptide repeat protein [Alphaproteobacteria bacterium]|nr:tetratricopeptide repeat protein [Alphaproteobacteria bacterium]